MNDVYYETELKLNINIEPVGDMTMDEYEFTVEAYTSPMRVLTIPKAQAVRVDANNYFVPIDTAKVGAGRLMCRVIATIPDNDMPNASRREVVSINTGITIKEKWPVSL